MAAALLVMAFHGLTIAAYQGNLTPLFYAGDQFPAPPALAEATIQVPQSSGFDGQFYYYIANDPLNRQDTAAYVDNPSMRWKRILFPGLAAVGALGQPALVPWAYAALMWLAVFTGVWALARLCLHWGLPAVAGLVFLAVPAVAVSIERMLTDIAIPLALIVILLAHAEKRPAWAYAAMLLVPLGRETGLVFAGASALWTAAHRQWKQAAVAVCTTVPFLAWAAWVHLNIGSDNTRWWGLPFQGIAQRLGVYQIYDAPLVGLKVALFTDYIGAWGILAAFVLAPFLFLRGERTYLLLTATLYTLAISVFAKEDMWGEAYSYTRIGGPVAVMLALHGVRTRRWWLLLPMAVALPRIALQYVAVILGDVRLLAAL
jgi:hypothetical protein